MLRVRRGRFGRNKGNKITKRSEPTQEDQDALLAQMIQDAEIQSAKRESKPPSNTLKTDWDAMKQRQKHERELAIRQAQIDKMQEDIDAYWKERGKRKPPPNTVYNINKKNKGALSAFMRRGNPKQQFQAIHPNMIYVNREKDGHCFYHSLAYGIGWQTNSTIEEFVNNNYFFQEGSILQNDLLRKTQDIKNKVSYNAPRWQERTEGLILRNVLETIYINEYRDNPSKIRQIIDGGDLAMRDQYIHDRQDDLDENLVEQYNEPVSLWPAAVERLEKVVEDFYSNKKGARVFEIGETFYMIAGSTYAVGARGVVTGYKETKGGFNSYYVKFDNGHEADLPENQMAHEYEVKEAGQAVRVHSFDSDFVKSTRSWASLGVIPFALNVFRERDEGMLKFCNNLTLYLYSERGVQTGADLWVRFYWDQRENRYRSCLVKPGEKVEIMCSIFMYFTGNHFDALHPTSTVGLVELNSLKYDSLDGVDDINYKPCEFEKVNLIKKLKL